MTTGAGNDLERSTELARKMVCEWGMSDAMGPLTFGKKEEQIFLGREIAQHQDYSEDTAISIDKEIRRIITDNYDARARRCIEQHQDGARSDRRRAARARSARCRAGPPDRRWRSRSKSRSRPRRPRRHRPTTRSGAARSGRRSCSRFRRSTSRWRRNRTVGTDLQSAVTVDSRQSRVDSVRRPRAVVAFAGTCLIRVIHDVRGPTLLDCRCRAARRSNWASARSSWGSSTSRRTPSPMAGGASTPRARWPTACRWLRTAPTSWTLAASRRGPAPSRSTPDEELRRVLPVVEALARDGACRCRSTPTRPPSPGGRGRGRGDRQRRQRPAVRRRNSRRSSPSAGAALVLMHNRGRSRRCTARRSTTTWPARSVGSSRRRSAGRRAAGSRATAIILDPGLGFAKRAEHTWASLARSRPAGRARSSDPVGPSRKSFLTAATGERSPDERDWATAAAVTASVLAGAHIVRVHDVREMVDVVRVVGPHAGRERPLGDRQAAANHANVDGSTRQHQFVR